VAQVTGVDVDRFTQLYFDILNRHDLNSFRHILAERYTNHSRMGTVQGMEAFQRLMAGVYEAFPDLHYVLDDVVVQGTRIVYRYHATATHRRQLFGLAATGRRVEVGAAEIDRFEDGKLVESWNYADLMGLMRQLGAITVVQNDSPGDQ
jgi:steroid delta-isomerase-like uncharacterized protein